MGKAKAIGSGLKAGWKESKDLTKGARKLGTGKVQKKVGIKTRGSKNVAQGEARLNRFQKNAPATLGSPSKTAGYVGRSGAMGGAVGGASGAAANKKRTGSFKGAPKKGAPRKRKTK